MIPWPPNSVSVSASVSELLSSRLKQPYTPGFSTDIDMDTIPPGLNEGVIRYISAKKNEPEFLLQFRLTAYRHWLTMKMPNWQALNIQPIDYQAISYFSAPASKKNAPKSLDEIYPKLLKNY